MNIRQPGTSRLVFDKAERAIMAVGRDGKRKVVDFAPLAAPSIAEAPEEWVQTLGGGFVDLIRPRPEQISFVAIATSLSRIPRFAGHTERAYSVAQHSTEGALAIIRDTGDDALALAFLLHDAHEYVIGDDVSPKLRALIALANTFESDDKAGEYIRRAFKLLKSRLDCAIYGAAGIAWPLPLYIRDIIAEYDLRMLRTERDAFMAQSPFPWVEAVESAEPIAGCDLHPTSEGASRLYWICTLNKLSKVRV